MQYRVVRYTTEAHEVVVEDIRTSSEAAEILQQIDADRAPSDDTGYGIEEYEAS